MSLIALNFHLWGFVNNFARDGGVAALSRHNFLECPLLGGTNTFKNCFRTNISVRCPKFRCSRFSEIANTLIAWYFQSRFVRSRECVCFLECLSEVQLYFYSWQPSFLSCPLLQFTIFILLSTAYTMHPKLIFDGLLSLKKFIFNVVYLTKMLLNAAKQTEVIYK